MRLKTFLLLLPVTVIAVMIAVANRENIAFRLDPFTQGDSALTLVMPLFLLVFLSFFVGVLVGGATVGLRRGARARQKRAAPQEIAGALALEARKPSADKPEA